MVQLAEATGFHTNTISKLKNLREMPNRLEKKTLDGLCRALNCKVSDLLEYEPDEGESSSGLPGDNP